MSVRTGGEFILYVTTFVVATIAMERAHRVECDYGVFFVFHRIMFAVELSTTWTFCRHILLLVRSQEGTSTKHLTLHIRHIVGRESIGSSDGLARIGVHCL